MNVVIGREWKLSGIHAIGLIKDPNRVLFGACHQDVALVDFADRHSHVRLTAGDPNFANQQIHDANFVLGIRDGERVGGKRSLERRKFDKEASGFVGEPIILPMRLRFVVFGQFDEYDRSRRRDTENSNRFVLLEHRVIRNQRMHSDRRGRSGKGNPGQIEIKMDVHRFVASLCRGQR